MSTNYLEQFSANLITISAVNINYSTLVGSTIIASSITTNSTINVSSITSRTINYSTLMGSTLTAQLINYSTLTGSTIIGNSVSIASTIITSSILTNGNVGIGTNTPNAPLQFSNAVVNRKIVLYEDTNNDNQFFGFGVNSFILRYQVSATTISHVFYAGTSSSASKELMRIMGTGNVGIGTNNPATTLELWSQATQNISANLTIRGYSMTAGTGPGINFYGWITATTPQGRIEVYDDSNFGGNMLFSCKGQGSGSGPLVERMRILGLNGNVGIGTNNPGFVLDVNGISATRSSFFINSQTYAPPATGDNGGAGIKMLLLPGGAGSYSYAIGIDAYKLWYSVPAAVHAWFINGTQVMTLSGAGALTIGGALTVGPAVLPVANSVGTTNLIVYGNINCYRNRLIFSDAATDWNHSIYNNIHNLDNEGVWDGMKFNVFNGAWFRVGGTRTTAMYINSSGSIGIGTTDPAALLSIVGPGATQTGNFSSSSTCTLSGNEAAYYSVWDGARSGAFGCDSSSNYVFTGSISSHDYVIRTNNSERIRVGATTGNVSVSGTLTGNSITSTTGTFNTSNSGGSMQILYYQIGHGGTVDFSNLLSYGSGRFFIVTLTNNYGGSAQTQGASYILFLPINHQTLQGAPAVLTQLYAAGGVSLTYTSAPATFTVNVQGQTGYLTLLRIGV